MEMPHSPALSSSLVSIAVCSACAMWAAPAWSDSLADMPRPAAVGTAVTATAIEIERGTSFYLGRIRADAAYARGLSGAGVTIATLDTGISGTHREFMQAGKLLPGLNAVTGGLDVTDRRGHGSHVAGIIAALRDGRGNAGVAHGATLLPIKIFPDSGSGSTLALDIGLRHAIGKAAIINLSIGASGPFDARAMQEAVKSGLLIVAAAGNDGAPTSNWPARFAREAWANNQIIAVGAVDASNRIASFSNRAGDTAAWYLVAPGVGVVSAHRNDQYASMSGTSMAAPMVSGAAALLMQMWPRLRADQVATILLVTATDLGAPGIDPIYGRGLLNIDKALKPVGTLTTTTYNGKTIRVLSGAMQPSAATSAIWSLAASGQLRAVGRDDFQRDFGIDLGRTVTRSTALSLDQVIGGMGRRNEVAERVFGDDMEMAFVRESWTGTGMGAMPAHLQAQAPRDRLAAFSLLARGRDGMQASFALGSFAGQDFGAHGLRLAPDLPLSQVAGLSNPYLSLLPSTTHFAVAREAGGYWVKAGLVAAGTHDPLASSDVHLPGAAWMPQARSGVFEVSRSFDGAALSMSLLQTRERNAYLGSYSSGALSIANRAATHSVQLAGAVLIMPQLALAGQASYGITPGRSGDSLVAGVTTLRTNAFSLALVAADRARRGDRLSLALSQPMRTYAGQLTMDVLSNEQVRDRLVFSMAPTGREVRGELSYQAPLGPLSSMGVSMMLRREPNNIADAALDKLLALRYATRF
ncbi:S8 family peptidase [Noviherbaspirillum sp. CPCC 100848]|uniref:S8 family peptidase n=2 Tax=Noviherbaspirillum album TaxID=3080276 RepID=A0ABU6J659_9BURK|nr:S8 family peptidase [Noviherbaspirillum sp. CPCC 100848]